MSTKEQLAKEEMKAKGKPLQKMFNQVPGKYDFLNRLLTLRFDEKWRKKAMKTIRKENPSRVMDVGTGTGDLAVRIARELSKAHVVGYDFSAPMLEEAKKKAKKHNLQNIEFIEGDAAEMPFEDNQYDVTGISFAFRNITFKNPNTKLYLQEIWRTLKPGGKFVIVESSQPNNRVVRYFFHLYLQYIVSGIGGMLAKSKGAYHYLAYSAKNFYTREELTQLLEQAGFQNVTHQTLLLGAAAVTTAEKPK